MSEKIPCQKCGAMILSTTAEKNDGWCLSCTEALDNLLNLTEEIEKSRDIPSLIEYLSKDHEVLSQYAARRLGQIDDTRVVEPLRNAASNSKVQNVRETATKMLEHIEKKESEKEQLEKIYEEEIFPGMSSKEKKAVRTLKRIYVGRELFPGMGVEEQKAFNCLFKNKKSIPFLVDFAVGYPYVETRRTIIRRLRNQADLMKILTQVSKENEHNKGTETVVEDIISRIENQEVLYDIIRKKTTWTVTRCALEYLRDQNLIAEIVQDKELKGIRYEAIEKLDLKANYKILSQIVSDSDSEYCLFAKKVFIKKTNDAREFLKICRELSINQLLSMIKKPDLDHRSNHPERKSRRSEKIFRNIKELWFGNIPFLARVQKLTDRDKSVQMEAVLKELIMAELRKLKIKSNKDVDDEIKSRNSERPEGGSWCSYSRNSTANEVSHLILTETLGDEYFNLCDYVMWTTSSGQTANQGWKNQKIAFRTGDEAFMIANYRDEWG